MRRLCKLCFADFLFRVLAGAVRAFVVLVVILMNDKYGRDDLECPDNILANRLHDSAANRAETLRFA